MIRLRPRRLRDDRRGVTIVEFALVVPVMLSLIMGFCEIAYECYVQSVLVGAMQRAGRNSTIEGNGTTAVGTTIDNMVLARVRSVSKVLSYESSRKSYAQFGQIKAEDYSDDNNNKQYDKATECFTDVNANKTWDKDPGLKGQGSANDVVVYRMDIVYARLLPVTRLIGLSATVPISATTILKNQPWKLQTAATPEQVCPKKP